MTAIVVANVQHITRSAVRTWRYAGLDQIPPDSERRPVSILSLSQSLDKPFETTRTHVNALVDEGLCVKTPTGVFVPAEVLLSKKLAAAEGVVWEAFLKMITDLRALGFDFNAVHGHAGAGSNSVVFEDDFSGATPGAIPRRLVARVVSEFYLNAIVGATAPYGGDWTGSLVFTAFMTLNVSAWTMKADEAWRYSRVDSPPPDHIRVPASIAEVAKYTGLGKELVRRQAHDLVESGRLVRKEEGLFASMEHMQGPASKLSGANVVTAFYRMIYDLTALGVEL